MVSTEDHSRTYKKSDVAPTGLQAFIEPLVLFVRDDIIKDNIGSKHEKFSPLLLTFFFRQMPELIEKGYLYIAQPPLFKVKKGKSENYLKDENNLSQYLVKLGVDKMEIQSSRNGISYSGESLETLVNNLSQFREVFGQAVRNNIPADILNLIIKITQGVFFSSFRKIDKKKSILNLKMSHI